MVEKTLIFSAMKGLFWHKYSGDVPNTIEELLQIESENISTALKVKELS